ncbi:MAG TPA: Ku protein, partial [Kutzneria sp.]|nr:Ku protein [Kutzneria sp.]
MTWPLVEEGSTLRSFWKGSIGFGLVSIPVKAYRATEEHGLGLHQVHAADGGRIRLRRFCELDDAEVPAAEVGRAAETGGGDVVLITEEDLATLPVPTLRTIAVHTFAPPEQIDSLYLSRNYYLEPDANGVRPYVLFAEALRRSGKVAVVKVAFRQRESMGVLRARDGVLVLATMVWPAEVRTPDFPFLDEDVDVRLPELKAATALIDCLAGDFDPGEYRDAYREALDELIEAKAAGDEVIRPEVPMQP